MKRILLIEDRFEDASLIMKVLRPHRYLINHVVFATAAMWAAQRLRFDLVLLDMGLLDMHGIQLARELQNIPLMQDTPIIAVTADTSVETLREAIALGCEEVIHKPINVDSFPDQIARYLQVQNS